MLPTNEPRGERESPGPASRLAGAVWGHLVGDAIGVPYEFREPEDIGEVVFGAEGTHGQPPGTWRDDGALMLATLDGLLQPGRLDPARLAERYLAWYRDGAYTPEHSGKFARLAELAEELASRQEKALVFTQFRELADPLARYLAGLFGRPGLVLHGQTPVKERMRLVERFQADETIPFFVLSLRAGGTGLNLTAASQVIHFDRWWNPAVENQATDRAFRIGQRRNVVVHKFVCRGTVEERIDALIEQKKGLAADVLAGGGEGLITELPDADVLRIVALDLESALAAD